MKIIYKASPNTLNKHRSQKLTENSVLTEILNILGGNKYLGINTKHEEDDL